MSTDNQFNISDETNPSVTSRFINNRLLVLDFIRNNSPIQKSTLCRKLKIKSSTMIDILRDLEIARLIESKTILDINNRAQRIVRLPDSRDTKLSEELRVNSVSPEALNLIKGDDGDEEKK